MSKLPRVLEGRQTKGQVLRADADKRAQRVRAHLAGSSDVMRRMEHLTSTILTAADLLVKTFLADRKVLLCGNGGSAADCQHLAAEFVGRLTKEMDRPGLPAIALTTDTSFLTAFANDTGYDAVFERQVCTLGKPGDALIAISTSGASRNVLRGVEAARGCGIRTVALTGGSGQLAQLAEVAIVVPSTNTQHIQETHLAIEHILVDLVERCLFDSDVEAGERGR